MDEAKRRRGLLEKESQLYGAMDGAMKFVKGDAIAGLIIVAVNLLGGILIGVDAARHARRRGGADLFDPDHRRRPDRADPGAVHLDLRRHHRHAGCVRQQRKPWHRYRRPTGQRTEGAVDRVRHHAGLCRHARFPDLCLPSSVRNYIDPRRLDNEVAKVRRALYFDLGVPFPGVHLRLNEMLEEDEYRILVNEIPVAAGKSRPGKFIVRETEANLKMFDIPYEKGDDFLPNTPSLWVSNKHEALLQRAEMQVLNLPAMLTYHLAHVLKSHAGEFVGVQETMYLLNEMEANFKELVREVTRALPIITIADVLQRLVSEEISIRDMRTILEALVEWGQREKDAILLTEHVRSALNRYITHKFAGGQSVISAYLLSKKIEDEVRGAIRQTSGASYLALSPDTHKKLLAGLSATIGDFSRHSLKPVVLAPMDIRRFMRKIVERDFPDLAILSFQELSPQVNIQPLERIDLR
jgi:type III secretion protein V